MEEFYCADLRELPQEMLKLKELKELIIDEVCIEKIPSQIGYLIKLEILCAQRCKSLVRLPDSFSNLVNLSTLDLRYCPKFEKFPDRIGSLMKLQRLLLGNRHLPYGEYQDLETHRYLDKDYYCFHHIPHSIGELKLLTELRLTFTKISELPESIGNLESLKILDIARCTELISLPGTISKLDKLEELDASACKSLGGKILRLGNLSCREDLLHSNTSPSSRQHLDLTNCDLPNKLSILEVTCQNCTLPRLSHLIDLKELKIQFCELLESIPMLPSRILKLGVSWCCKLKELPSLLSLELLSKLSIEGCSELIEIKDLEGLKSLGNLFLSKCDKLSNLKGFEHLESLRKSDAPFINDDASQVQCPGGFKSLDFVSIDSCHSLERLDISQLTHLKHLSVYNCKSLVEIKCHGRLKNLIILFIGRCDSIETIPPPSLFDNLNLVTLEWCPKLRDVQAWRKSKQLLIELQGHSELSRPVASWRSY
ncbi:hypothetical protein EUGRSUZ_L03184 [Eucalyptus grandis]|uniref:Disease resistance R13L4/SHOC-2-like LRR domain-containing protein n=1 Tax=Eucalyptus grandis TaxID=71139 RepID=A0AAD9T7Z8_EUCGR|nr:hypothetical protein EUGRSUZ_L03184 [Eucalyptus grandis]